MPNWTTATAVPPTAVGHAVPSNVVPLGAVGLVVPLPPTRS